MQVVNKLIAYVDTSSRCDPYKGRTLGIGEVRFTGQTRLLSKKITYRIDLKRVVDRKLNIGIADGKAFVDGRKIYFAKDLRVCLAVGANDGNSPVRRGGRTSSLV